MLLVVVSIELAIGKVLLKDAVIPPREGWPILAALLLTDIAGLFIGIRV